MPSLSKTGLILSIQNRVNLQVSHSTSRFQGKAWTNTHCTRAANLMVGGGGQGQAMTGFGTPISHLDAQCEEYKGGYIR